MSAMREAAQQYVEAGYALAAWERRLGKGPRDKELGAAAVRSEGSDRAGTTSDSITR